MAYFGIWHSVDQFFSWNQLDLHQNSLTIYKGRYFRSRSSWIQPYFGQNGLFWHFLPIWHSLDQFFGWNHWISPKTYCKYLGEVFSVQIKLDQWPIWAQYWGNIFAPQKGQNTFKKILIAKISEKWLSIGVPHFIQLYTPQLYTMFRCLVYRCLFWFELNPQSPQEQSKNMKCW